MEIPKELKEEVASFVAFLDSPIRINPDQYELVESRFNCIKFLTQRLEHSENYSQEELKTFGYA